MLTKVLVPVRSQQSDFHNEYENGIWVEQIVHYFIEVYALSIYIGGLNMC